MTLNIEDTLKMAQDMAAQMGGADLGTNPSFALAVVCMNLAERLKTQAEEIAVLQSVVAAHEAFTTEAGPRIEQAEKQLLELAIKAKQAKAKSREPRAVRSSSARP